MVESYATALSGVLSALQGTCRNEDTGARKECKRQQRETLMMLEVLHAGAPEYRAKEKATLETAQSCYDKCKIVGKNRVRECNSRCLNVISQDIWKDVWAASEAVKKAQDAGQ
ncbi:unnamed protein product [Blepharisma stoltei]|uniref:Uncharacterized protein n=1 Tax=Blepharisma stoltei TaxID=1481888 RepID=A0AAU9IBR3_9CILI|nr:unnamed protein product [Blepharisma stoltei]